MKLIAELCQNHNGDEALLEQMVHAAAEAGATHVKIQNIYVKNLTYRPQFEDGLVVNGVTHSIKRPFHSEYERLKTLELSEGTIRNFINLCLDLKVVPLTTCFARDDIKQCLDLGFPEIKVASYDCASFPLLRELAKSFKHIYVSTGATFDHEIAYAAQILNEQNTNFSLLHCVTKYPTQLHDFNLERLNYLQQFCTEVGLSDHSLVERDGIIASLSAIMLGASVIERHFTILEKDKTKDGPVSITPSMLNELASFSKLNQIERQAYLTSLAPEWKNILIGQSKRELTDEELLNRDYYRGRFASPIFEGQHNVTKMVFNWEETPLQ